jgi:hypothetical protein
VKGIFSFHPVKIEFFDEIVQPLVAGRKVNPETYLNDALRLRSYSSRTRRYLWALEDALVIAEPPRPEKGAGILKNLRTQLERFDHREDELTRLIKKTVEPDLHLRGRPFFVTEGSAHRVAERVDEYFTAHNADAVDTLAIEQLAHLETELAKQLQPAVGPDLTPNLAYRADLLADLKELYDIPIAARQGDKWGRADRPRLPASEVLAQELPHKALMLHARAVPFWIAHDVDGLETVCRAAGVDPPDFIVTPRRLFAETCEEFPDLAESLQLEVQGPAGIGAFVAPGDIPALTEFLSSHGARIIQVATQHGEGPACATLLRKIRECAAYAERTASGYIEASGIRPPELGEPDDEPEDDQG